MTLKELIKDRGLTQMALAEKIGKSQELISKWCNNLNMPNIVDLVNLSTILQVSVKHNM